LQRVGLQPQFKIRPTVAGIRAGRDEVLEAALRLIAGDVRQSNSNSRRSN
jgi:hypothetical protein